MPPPWHNLFLFLNLAITYVGSSDPSPTIAAATKENRRGLLLSDHGKHREGIAVYLSALHLLEEDDTAPSNNIRWALNHNLGLSFSRLGEMHNSTLYYREALKYNSKTARTHLVRGKRSTADLLERNFEW